MLNLITIRPEYLSLGQSSSPVARISSACGDLHDSNDLAYSPEFKRTKDWSNQYSFICDTNLNNLESQPRFNRGGYGKKQTVPQ